MRKKTMIMHDKQGNEMTVPVRSALPVDAPCARYTGYKPETLLLKKGSVRLKGYMPLPCDIILERDVPVKLRDGVTIYTDIFRLNDDRPHPAIMAMSPYGKQIGSQWLDDTPTTRGSPWTPPRDCKSLKVRIRPTGATTAMSSSIPMSGGRTIPRA